MSDELPLDCDGGEMPEIAESNEAPMPDDYALPAANENVSNFAENKAKINASRFDDASERSDEDTAISATHSNDNSCGGPSQGRDQEAASQRTPEAVVYEVPGRLVEEPSRSLQPISQQPEAPAPICDAIPLPVWSQIIQELRHNPALHNGQNTDEVEPQPSHTPQSEPWWKRHGLVLFISSVVLLVFSGMMVAAIGVLVVQRKNAEGESNQTLPFSEGHTFFRGSTTSVPTSPTTIIDSTSSFRNTSFDFSTTTIASSNETAVATDTTIASTRNSTETASTSKESTGTEETAAATTPTPTTTKSIATTTPKPLCPNLIETLLDSDCQDCYPVPAFEGDTAVVSRKFESIQFFLESEDDFNSQTSIEMHSDMWDASIFRNFAIVGAPYENDNTGAVYIFERKYSGTWEKTERVVPDDVVGKHSRFGYQVSIYDDVFVVGAYVYRRFGSTWTLETKLAPKDSSFDLPGIAVSVVGNTIAIGERSRVFVFYYDFPSDSWKQFGEGIASDDCEYGFGSNVALAPDNEDERNLDNGGAVYYFRRSGDEGEYVFQQKIIASDAASHEYFGGWDRIALDEDSMVVGTNLENNGKVYIFSRAENGWNEVGKIDSPDGSYKYFGFRVALSKKKILISSSTNVYAYNWDYC